MVPILALILAAGPMVISRSGKFPAKTYFLPVAESGGPAVVIRGDNLTVDFAGSVFRGSPASAWPNERKGLGVQVIGNNVTIKNLRVHGYKVGLLAKQCRNLKILDSDFSYNWKQRLGSTPEREDAADWMSFHHNENSEWLGYGAGIYLDECQSAEVKATRITGGQCGLMMNRSNEAKIWNNDFSYLSGVGLGLYRSSMNVVMHNRIDYCVRGFSYGVYNRGQDSAGILIFEQCNQNVFAYNSVTHGGDGFFLWAGQHTMDTGEGGCNDNVVYKNDFSFAPTNGIEATFSRNTFIGNRVHGCFHGVWGGYSYDSEISGNDFKGNQRAIAIEHGTANRIRSNRFDGDDVAIALWAPPVDPKFVYAQRHETRSMNTDVSGNYFVETPLGLDLRNTTLLNLSGNTFFGVPQPTRIAKGEQPFVVPDSVSLNLLTSAEGVPYQTPIGSDGANKMPTLPTNLGTVPRPLPGGLDALKPKPREGWPTILVDEWGPYDYRRPLLSPVITVKPEVPLPGGTSPGSGINRPQITIAESNVAKFNVLGPAGKWRVIAAKGIRLSTTSGAVPGLLTGERVGGEVKIELEYVGSPTTDVRGQITPAGKPIRFGYEKFSPAFEWAVQFFGWKESVNPADPHAVPKDFDTVLQSSPIKTLKTDQLEFAGYAMAPGLPTTHYATRAEGSVTVPAGEYLLDLTCDDGARLWLDGKLLIDDAWHYQGPTLYTRKVRLGGRHRLRVEHFQIDGYATLKVGIRKANQS